MSWTFQTAAPVKNSRRQQYNLVRVANSENNWLMESIAVSPPLSSLHSAHQLSNCPHRRLPDPRHPATCRVNFVVRMPPMTKRVLVIYGSMLLMVGLIYVGIHQYISSGSVVNYDRKIEIHNQSDLENFRGEFYDRYNECCHGCQCGQIGFVESKYESSQFAISFSVLSCIPENMTEEWLTRLSEKFLLVGVDLNEAGPLDLIDKEFTKNAKSFHGTYKNSKLHLDVKWSMHPIPSDGHQDLRVEIQGKAF